MLVYAPSLWNGIPPNAHSYVLNVNWSEAFTNQLSWSEVYPRWLESLWNDTGSADFYFYAPLAFYLSAGMQHLCDGCGVEESLTLAAFALRLIGALGVAALASRLGLQRWAWIAAVFFMIAPYATNNWAYRQAFGELAGSAFLSLFLLGLLQALQGGRGWILTVATFGLVFSHLPTALIAAVAGLVMTLALWRPASGRASAVAAGAGTLGVLIATIYWMPAIALLDTVNSSALEAHGWQQGQFYPFTPQTWRHFRWIWLPFLLLTVLTIGVLGAGRTARPPSVRLVGIALLLSWFMVVNLSAFIWEYTPLGRIQFPFRFLALTDIAFAIAASQAAHLAFGRGGRRTGIAGKVLLGLFFLVASERVIAGWAHVGPHSPRVVLYEQARIGAVEWLGTNGTPTDITPSLVYKGGLPLPDAHAPSISVSDGALEIHAAGGRVLDFTADCPNGCRLNAHRGYWRYWRLVAVDTGTDLPLRATDGFPLIAATLPEGKRRLRLELERPAVEGLAWGISAGALAITLLWMLASLRHRKSQVARVQ